VAGPGPDRFVSPDLEAVTALVLSGAVAALAEEIRPAEDESGRSVLRTADVLRPDEQENS
jgi:hypothetical protein